MKKNLLTASIVFYFKGEKFEFSADIDVDKWLRDHLGDFEYVYDVLAFSNGLDRYRHEYDVMVMEPVIFLSGTRLVASFIEQGAFDLIGFQRAHQQHQALSALHPIAKQHLDINNLDDHPDIKAALLAAYHAKE